MNLSFLIIPKSMNWEKEYKSIKPVPNQYFWSNDITSSELIRPTVTYFLQTSKLKEYSFGDPDYFLVMKSVFKTKRQLFFLSVIMINWKKNIMKEKITKEPIYIIITLNNGESYLLLQAALRHLKYCQSAVNITFSCTTYSKSSITYVS